MDSRQYQAVACKMFCILSPFLRQTNVFYLLYDGDCARSHGNHGGDGIVSLWTKLCDLLDVNWMKKNKILSKWVCLAMCFLSFVFLNQWFCVHHCPARLARMLLSYLHPPLEHIEGPLFRSPGYAYGRFQKSYLILDSLHSFTANLVQNNSLPVADTLWIYTLFTSQVPSTTFRQCLFFRCRFNSHLVL